MNHSLDWEEGYRSAIETCLTTMLLSEDHKKIWKYLADLYVDSAIRTDRLLDRMNEECRWSHRKNFWNTSGRIPAVIHIR